MGKDNKIDFYLNGCKKLVDMSYNQLNLDNYKAKVDKVFNISSLSSETSSKGPIKLMSGQHKYAGIISSHIPGDTLKGQIIIVGKGVLFDSGGYNLKTSEFIGDMKSDMAGMATAMAVASYFRNEKGIQDVVAYCPVATNFIHNNEIIPGDYIKVGSKEIEITNTDAEGRLILAEALSELKLYKTDIVITVATLTGHVKYAIGNKATAILTPNSKLAEDYLRASLKTKELAWRLPLWNYLQKGFDKKRIKNASKQKCGTIMGGMFVKQFVKYSNNWIHLDIAFSAYDENKNKATGQPIKTLIEFIKHNLLKGE